MIPGMRAASTAMIVVGFGIGFGLMYSYISPRAADIAKPIPQFVPQSASGPAQPRVDPAVVRQLEDTLKGDPKNFAALRELGNIRYDERNFEEAAAIYARALAVEPDNVDVRSDRGGALLQSNHVDEAIGELKTALSKNPTHPQSLFILGVALFQGKNDREGALAAWNKLVQSHPELPELELVKQQIKQVEDLARRK
jgi:cytochrome c-type biogenesis protein CcmH/NrfG